MTPSSITGAEHLNGKSAGAPAPASPRAPTTSIDRKTHTTAVVSVPAGGTVPVSFMLKRSARIVDVFAAEGIEVDSVKLGRRIVERGGAPSIAHALAEEPFDGNAGLYCAIRLSNATSEAVNVKASVVVENEHGPEVDGQAPFRVGDGGQPAPSARVRVAAPREVAPREVRPRPQPALDPPASASSGPGRAARGGGVRRPPPGTDTKQRRRGAERQEVVTVPVVAVAPDGYRVITLYRSYADTLASFFAYRAPIRREHRPFLTERLRAAAASERDDAEVNPGEVAIVLRRGDVERLSDAIRLHREYQLLSEDGVDEIRDAILRATDRAVPPSEVPVAAVTESAAAVSNERARVRAERSESEAEVLLSAVSDQLPTSVPVYGPSNERARVRAERSESEAEVLLSAVSDQLASEAAAPDETHVSRPDETRVSHQEASASHQQMTEALNGVLPKNRPDPVDGRTERGPA